MLVCRRDKTIPMLHRPSAVPIGSFIALADVIACGIVYQARGKARVVPATVASYAEVDKGLEFFDIAIVWLCLRDHIKLGECRRCRRRIRLFGSEKWTSIV